MEDTNFGQNPWDYESVFEKIDNLWHVDLKFSLLAFGANIDNRAFWKVIWKVILFTLSR